jgi:parvulin-like peptidyl-prolyl isomerase
MVAMEGRMRALLLLVALAVGLSPATARSGDRASTGAGARGVVVERVALVVNGQPVFASQLARRPEAELIDEVLVLAWAGEVAASLQPDDVDRAIDQIKTANGIDDAGLAVALTEQGYTLADYREELGRQILRLRIEQLLVLRELGAVGDDPEATRAAFMATWLAEQRRHAYIERPVAP